MKCEKCQSDVTPENQKEHNGQILCEDCYMDALSPPRACDPWAVYAAKSFSESGTGNVSLNQAQQSILNLLKTSGDTSVDDIANGLHLKPADVEREIATLRHMEKIKGALVAGKRVIRLW